MIVQQTGKLQEILTDLLEQGEAPFMLLAVVSKHFLQLLEVSLLRKERNAANSSDIAVTLGIHPFPAEKLWRDAGKVGIEQTEKALDIILQTDRDMKTGKGNPDLLLEASLSSISAICASTG